VSLCGCAGVIVGKALQCFSTDWSSYDFAFKKNFALLITILLYYLSKEFFNKATTSIVS
jgi:hypothetical protein